MLQDYIRSCVSKEYCTGVSQIRSLLQELRGVSRRPVQTFLKFAQPCTDLYPIGLYHRNT
jgi:hypothetical protein